MNSILEQTSIKDKALDTTQSGCFSMFTELMGWLQIVTSPLLIGGVIGVIIYAANPGSTTLFIGIVLTIIGLIIGIIWATRVSKKEGASHFISKILETPDIEDTNKLNKESD